MKRRSKTDTGDAQGRWSEVPDRGYCTATVAYCIETISDVHAGSAFEETNLTACMFPVNATLSPKPANSIREHRLLRHADIDANIETGLACALLEPKTPYLNPPATPQRLNNHPSKNFSSPRELTVCAASGSREFDLRKSHSSEPAKNAIVLAIEVSVRGRVPRRSASTNNKAPRKVVIASLIWRISLY